LKFELLNKSFPYDTDLKITLEPSYRCNQQCWFCTEYDNNSKDYTINDIDNIIIKLKEILNTLKIKTLFIYIYGGEPTLNINLFYMLKELDKLIFNYNFDKSLIQIQSNLSISTDRLLEISRYTFNTKLEICSSYHVGYQSVKTFLDKLDILNNYNKLGYCFVNSDYTQEDRFIEEFNILSKKYPDKIKIRFTEVELNFKNKDKISKYPKMDKKDLFEFEYKYFSNKYTYLLNYLEDKFTFNFDDKVLNYSELVGKSLNYFRMFKCEAGKKSIVIDHQLIVYPCTHYAKYNICSKKLEDFNINDLKSNYCLLYRCYDGLEFKKWKN